MLTLIEGVLPVAWYFFISGQQEFNPFRLFQVFDYLPIILG